MNFVTESIAPYGLTSKELPKLGLWCAKHGGYQCVVIGVILGKDLFNAIPTYKLSKKYKDEQILVLASCVTSLSPELSEKDYIPSIATFTLQEFEKDFEEDISTRFVSGPLASALASMYI